MGITPVTEVNGRSEWLAWRVGATARAAMARLRNLAALCYTPSEMLITFSSYLWGENEEMRIMLLALLTLGALLLAGCGQSAESAAAPVADVDTVSETVSTPARQPTVTSTPEPTTLPTTLDAQPAAPANAPDLVEAVPLEPVEKQVAPDLVAAVPLQASTGTRNSGATAGDLPVVQEATSDLTSPPAQESAPPAQESAPPAQESAPALAAPVWIEIPAIAMSQPLSPVGLDANGIPIVPNHDAAWFNLSARPGEGDNVVLWGHVLRFRYAPDVPAPFANVENLSIGATITVYDANDGVHTYAVSEQVWVEPHQVEYILPVGSERLTLVSCIGDQVIVDGSVVNMTHRLITIATPVN